MLQWGLPWHQLTTYLEFAEVVSAPGTPETNAIRLYATDNGSGVSSLCYKTDAGVVVCLPTVGPIAVGTASALTKTDDTNVTLTLGGTPTLALLATTSLTLGWTGTLADARLSTTAVTPAAYGSATASPTFTVGATGRLTAAANVTITPAASSITSPGALTKTDDTNVTLTLGGSPTVSLLAASSLTLGWSGQLSVARGGTSLNAAGHLLNTTLWDDVTASVVARGDVITGQGASAKWNRLAKGTANQALTMDGTATDVVWASVTAAPNALLDASAHSDTTASAVTRGDLVYGNSTPAWDDLAVGASAGMFLRTDATDVMWSTLILPNAITANNIVYGSATNTYGQSTNLTFDGTDFLLGSGIRARMVAQNRFRYLNSAVTARRSAAQTGLAVNVWTTATFGAEDFDTDTLHSTASLTSELIAAIAGKYIVTGSLRIDATNSVGSNLIAVRIIKNGGTTVIYAGEAAVSSGAGNEVSCCGIVSLAATDYVEMQGIVTAVSGTYDLNLPVDDTTFCMAYVGE